MKIQILTQSIFLGLLSLPLGAETLQIQVNGMVCSFCAQGIDKTFRKESTVEDVKVNLEKKVVVVKTKDKDSLDDAKIKEIITNSGYELKSIQRSQK